ncbi:sodium:sulfate symporter [Pandoraea fibrosis]|uniref:Sodium:sulfate symporter n=1 Tax=Pandoraea fibrosis TaxID=1891094 RepID=A0ABX6HPQ0_9BURK|nr:SLC13 family permease [Pandoraea fibrosis]QHE94196.1 sodium:sulfate symporter [Pandoraea fibrosis]QHF12240.1 sodium:sulfate symporter [Pandoraea fibrosis]
MPPVSPSSSAPAPIATTAPADAFAPGRLWRHALLAGLSAAAGLALHTAGLRGDTLAVAVIVLFCLSYWATGWLPDFLVSLVLLFLLATCTSLGANVVFSGFASSAFWLVFSGAVVGMALSVTGLGERVASRLADHCGHAYGAALTGFVVVAFVLGIVMPSTLGRIAILTPIVLSFCERVGLTAGRPGRTGLLLATALASCELSSAILPANLPNLVMAGTAETVLGLRLGYGEYAMALVPGLAVVRGVVLVVVALRCFPDRLTPLADIRINDDTHTAMRPDEWRLLAALALMLGLWLTEPWHHVAAGWVGLGVALLCLGPLRLVNPDAFLKQVKLAPLWFVAAIIGLTAAVDQAGLAQALRPVLSRLDLAQMSTVSAYLVLVALSIALTFLVTSNAAPALYTPLVPALAAGAPLGVKAILLTQAIGISTIALPYQAPPLVLAMALAGIGIRDATRYCIATALVALVTVVPLSVLWWQVIGLLRIH